MFGMEDDNIPERIGKFRILELVAKSMALVYKAEQDDPKRVVALKIPRGGKLLSREARDRFVREIGLTAGIDHSGIVPVLEAGEIDGMPYYTMPFVEGMSLGNYLQSTDLNRTACLDLFLRICDVVQALHSRDLVHRDLKPDNIMIDEHNDVRLLDFGLARACDESSPVLTMDNSLLGTLQFMAPEQAEPGGTRKLTPATDVYSLGMILYFMLVNDYPYSVKGPREVVLQNIRNANPELPSTHDASISEALDKTVLATLSKNPSSRPSTAGELAVALRELTTGPMERPVSKQARMLPALTILCIVLAVTAGLWIWRNSRVDRNLNPETVGAPLSEHARTPATSPESRPATEPELVPAPELVSSAMPKPSERTGSTGRSGFSGSLPPPPEKPTIIDSEHTPEPGRPVPAPLPALVTPVRIEVVDKAHLTASGSGQKAARGGTPVPVRFWPLYDKAVSVLKDEFAHRRDGAVLICAESLVHGSSSDGTLSWQFEGEDESSERTIPADGIATLFFPAGRQCHIELRSQNGVIRRSITVLEGGVEYLEM